MSLLLLLGGAPVQALPPGASGPLPYLEWCGTELANAARTIEYLRLGLADSAQGYWDLGEGDLCQVLYRDAAFDVQPASGPAGDPAPWYDPTERGSSSFLGMVLLAVEGYDSTLQRTVPQVGRISPRSASGQSRRSRTWKFRGALVSADSSGAEYGLRWLTDVLQASQCDTCAACDLTVRLVCPPADGSNDALGRWTSHEAVLVSGPSEVEQFAPRPQTLENTLAGCRTVTVVEFEIATGNPWLYREPERYLDPVTVGDPDGSCDDMSAIPGGFYPGAAVPGGRIMFSDVDVLPVCTTVAPPVRGVLGAIFTFVSTSGMGPLLLEAYDVCPGTSPGLPELQMVVSAVPADSTLVVDCSRRDVRLTTSVGGEQVTVSRRDLLELPAGRGLEWIEVRDCDAISCFCVRPFDSCVGGGDTTVAIDVQAREG